MDRYLRILQRQVLSQVDLNSLPLNLQQYIVNIERIANVDSIFNVVIDEEEAEYTFLQAFQTYGSLGTAYEGLPTKVGMTLTRYLTRNGLAVTLNNLAGLDPYDLAARKGIGPQIMAVAAQVLAETGRLNETWGGFILKNRRYLSGESRDVRHY